MQTIAGVIDEDIGMPEGIPDYSFELLNSASDVASTLTAKTFHFLFIFKISDSAVSSLARLRLARIRFLQRLWRMPVLWPKDFKVSARLVTCNIIQC